MKCYACMLFLAALCWFSAQPSAEMRINDSRTMAIGGIQNDSSIGGTGGPRGALRDSVSVYDRNNDGLVNLEEFDVTGSDVAGFVAIDLNKDGIINPSEMDARLSAEAPGARSRLESFSTLDADHNGRITSNEFAASRSHISFVALDANGDDIVSRSEVGAYLLPR